MAKKKGFEEILEEVDAIVDRLEEGEVPLDEALKEYEKANKLLIKASNILEEAKGKVIKVTDSKDGTPKLDEVK